MPAIRTKSLEIGYEAHGPQDGLPVVLLHGFPDDVRCWDGVAPKLAEAGMRVLVPWLRGYGPTRLLDPATPRSGQQAALGADLRDFLDALEIDRAVLAGYDWGGRAACVVAALWPERARGLVSIGGYNIQDIAQAAAGPGTAEQEFAYWYQWYFHIERGRIGLSRNRRELCRKMWRLWSPNYMFDEAAFAATAAAWDNADFVEIVIQSYRHRYRAAPGDPALEALEVRLAAQPPIGVPSVVLEGEADGVTFTTAEDRAAAHFTGPYRRAVIPIAGHFLPREAPDAVVDAVMELA